LGDYWRAWNIPVHKWVLRTVYFPAMTHYGFSRYGAMVLTFFVSAVMHELAIGVPLRMVRGWAFAGIMFQVPLITLTEALRRRLKSDALGNLIFWCSFCVFGQPVAVLAYFHDFMVIKNAAKAAAIAQAAAGPAAVGLLLP
jgi:diacylglycerol O-acyltransferase-1